MSFLSDLRKTFGPSDILRFNTSISSSGDNTVVAAVTGKKIRVIAAYWSQASAVNLKWTSSTTSDLTKLFYMPSTQPGFNLHPNPAGWFETVVGELLGCNLSSGVVVSVGGLYITI